MTAATLDPTSTRLGNPVAKDADLSQLSSASFEASKARALGRLENPEGIEESKDLFDRVRDGLSSIYENKGTIAAGALTAAAIIAGYNWDLPGFLSLGAGDITTGLESAAEVSASVAPQAIEPALGPSVVEVAISGDPAIDPTPLVVDGEQHSLDSLAEKLDSLVPNPEAGDSLRIVPSEQSRPSFEGRFGELLQDHEIPYTTSGPYADGAQLESLFDPHGALEKATYGDPK